MALSSRSHYKRPAAHPPRVLRCDNCNQRQSVRHPRTQAQCMLACSPSSLGTTPKCLQWADAQQQAERPTIPILGLGSPSTDAHLCLLLLLLPVDGWQHAAVLARAVRPMRLHKPDHGPWLHAAGECWRRGWITRPTWPCVRCAVCWCAAQMHAQRAPSINRIGGLVTAHPRCCLLWDL